MVKVTSAARPSFASVAKRRSIRGVILRLPIPLVVFQQDLALLVYAMTSRRDPRQNPDPLAFGTRSGYLDEWLDCRFRSHTRKLRQIWQLSQPQRQLAAARRVREVVAPLWQRQLWQLDEVAYSLPSA